MKLKKLLVFLVVLTLLVSIVSCKKAETAKDDNTDAGDQQPADQNQQQPADQNQQQPAANGKYGSWTPKTLANPNISVWEEGSEVNGWKAEQVTAWAEDHPGGALTWKLIGGDQGFVAGAMAQMAAGDYADVSPVWPGSTWPVWAIKDIIQPIEPYVDLTDFNQELLKSFKWKGKIYGAAGNSSIYVLLYNKTLFDNEGLEDPFELQKQGKWNWAAFRQAGMAITKDLNGDGQTDQWGYEDVRGPTLLHLVGSNGGYLIKEDANGNFVQNLKDPKVLEACEFFLDMYQTSKFAMPVFGTAGRTPFLDGQIGILYEWDPPGEERGGSFFRAVTFPAGPSLPAGELPRVGRAEGQGITKGAKNPEGAAEYIKWVIEYNKKKDADSLAKMTAEEKAERQLLIERKQPSPTYGYFWIDAEELRQTVYPVNMDNIWPGVDKLYGDIMTQIWQEGKTPATVLEGKVPEFDAAIKDLMAGKLPAEEPAK